MPVASNGTTLPKSEGSNEPFVAPNSVKSEGRLNAENLEFDTETVKNPTDTNHNNLLVLDASISWSNQS